MYVDFEWLHPTNFKFMSNLLINVMNNLAELLTDFSLNMNTNILREQLKDFVGK